MGWFLFELHLLGIHGPLSHYLRGLIIDSVCVYEFIPFVTIGNLTSLA